MIFFTVEKQGLSARSQRDLKRIWVQAIKNMLTGWRDTILPGHFKPGAGNKYKYQPRTRQYAALKRRRGLGPLEFSGKAKRRMLADRREPTGASKKITLRLWCAGWFNRRYRGWKHKMADEVKAMTKSELREMYEKTQQRIALSMNDKTFKKITRIRGS